MLSTPFIQTEISALWHLLLLQDIQEFKRYQEQINAISQKIAYDVQATAIVPVIKSFETMNTGLANVEYTLDTYCLFTTYNNFTSVAFPLATSAVLCALLIGVIQSWQSHKTIQDEIKVRQDEWHLLHFKCELARYLLQKTQENTETYLAFQQEQTLSRTKTTTFTWRDIATHSILPAISNCLSLEFAYIFGMVPALQIIFKHLNLTSVATALLSPTGYVVSGVLGFFIAYLLCP